MTCRPGIRASRGPPGAPPPAARAIGGPLC